MGYSQVTPGVTGIGPGTTLMFDKPICPQLAIQVSYTNNVTVVLEGTIDGTNFFPVGITWTNSSAKSGEVRGTSTRQWLPLAGIRYNVSTIGGSADIAIAAA